MEDTQAADKEKASKDYLLAFKLVGDTGFEPVTPAV